MTHTKGNLNIKEWAAFQIVDQCQEDETILYHSFYRVSDVDKEVYEIEEVHTLFAKNMRIKLQAKNAELLKALKEIKVISYGDGTLDISEIAEQAIKNAEG